MQFSLLLNVWRSHCHFCLLITVHTRPVRRWTSLFVMELWSDNRGSLSMCYSYFIGVCLQSNPTCLSFRIQRHLTKVRDSVRNVISVFEERCHLSLIKRNNFSGRCNPGRRRFGPSDAFIRMSYPYRNSSGYTEMHRCIFGHQQINVPTRLLGTQLIKSWPLFASTTCF